MKRAHSIWTYLMVFLVLHLGSHISLLGSHNTSVGDYYLPTAFSIIFLNWVGLRYVLPMMYLNAVCTSYLWGNPIENWPLWFLFAIPESIYPLLSWSFFNKLQRGKFWLPDINNTVKFMVFGIFIPALITSLLLHYLLLATGIQGADTFWSFVGNNLLAEFTSEFFLTLPVLYYLTPLLNKSNFFRNEELKQIGSKSLSKMELILLGLVFAILVALAFVFEFNHYWYLYGIFPLYVAIRGGFGPVILTNLFLILLIYVFPRFFHSFGLNEIKNYEDTMRIFLGANFVFVFAALTGRVIDDLRETKQMLIDKNQSLNLTVKELEKSNHEIDQFAYSVSHDLSAPLKSIQGLINVSKLSHNYQEHMFCFDQIGRSVRKLESFISEVSDYSKNNRQQLSVEPISVQELCLDVLDGLSLFNADRPIEIDYNLTGEVLHQDKTRLRMVLKSIIFNAIQYQKDTPGHQPVLMISASRQYDYFRIAVEDNGEGITEEVRPHIFKMFYRGNLKSSGSGLGLYIARLAVERMKGKISVESTPGKGTTVFVDLPDLPDKHQ